MGQKTLWPGSLEDMLRRTPGLWAHSLEVARLAALAAKFLPSCLAPKTTLLCGALLHDVGKARWPDELFTKRILTSADWRVIKAHPVSGADLVSEMWPDAPEGVKEIVLQHHERPGGGGYPYGAAPSPAAILVAACDVVAAMAADRGYRQALSLKRAFAELAKWAPEDVAEAVKTAALELSGVLRKGGGALIG